MVKKTLMFVLVVMFCSQAFAAKITPITREEYDFLAGKGITVSRDELVNMLANMSAIGSDARIAPSFSNGKVLGFKLFSFRPDSVYARLGFQSGDTITRVEGINTKNPDDALEAAERVISMAHSEACTLVKVEILRRGIPENLLYAIE